MKKSIIASLLSVALVLVMVLALVPTTASAASANAKVDLPYNNVAPKTDGVVNPNEYSLLPLRKVDYNNDEFLSEHDPNQSIEADFYACWDTNSIYLAWVVYSELDDYYSPDPDGYMWEHCCVQYLLLPYSPLDAEAVAEDTFAGDWFEGGVTMYNGDTPVKCNWSSPTSVGSGLTTADWDFMGSVDKSGDQIVVTYEVRMPWKASGVSSVGNGTVIGLSWAIADQEDYTNVEKNMCEWQDAILGSKQGKNMAVVTLVGNDTDDKTEVSLDVGKEESVVVPTRPADIDTSVVPTDAVSISLVPFNATVATGGTTVVTDLTILNTKNPVWAANALLRPTDEAGVYQVVEIVEGTGNEITFTAETKEGDIVLVVHGDDSEGADPTSMQNRNALLALTTEDTVTFLGYDFETLLHATNAVVYYGVKAESGETSDVSEVPNESSEDESSEVPNESSETESSATESSDVSEDKDDEKGGNTGLIIGIVVAVVAVIAVVVVVVLKKKK